MNHGKIYVIAAPSGAGKSSLVNALLQHDQQIQLSISHTTRAQRAGEIDGVNYHFIQQEQFLKMVKANEFLEYAQVYDNFYGTAIHTIKEFLATGKDILLEIDWQGAAQIRQIFNDAIRIFILPPTIAALEHRLRLRNTDSTEVINQRLNAAHEDISHAPEFDYIIINDNFDAALQDLCSIIRAERKKSLQVWDTIKKQFNL